MYYKYGHRNKPKNLLLITIVVTLLAMALGCTTEVVPRIYIPAYIDKHQCQYIAAGVKFEVQEGEVGTPIEDGETSEFLKSLKWVAEYYFKGCSSWSWKFPYSHSPFISDVYSYINTHITTNIVDINEIEIPDDGCLSPCQQLLAVLPPACSNLLPQEYRYLTTSERSSIIDFSSLIVSGDISNFINSPSPLSVTFTEFAPEIPST